MLTGLAPRGGGQTRYRFSANSNGQGMGRRVWIPRPRAQTQALRSKDGPLGPLRGFLRLGPSAQAGVLDPVAGARAHALGRAKGLGPRK